MAQTNLNTALNFKVDGPVCSLMLPSSVCFGNTASGGFVSAVMSKLALSYASRQPRMANQTDVRSSQTQFFRPIFPTRGPVMMNVKELSVGKAFSTLRVEMYQSDMSKLAVTSDVLITNLSAPGPTYDVQWNYRPTSRPTDLSKLEDYSDQDWLGYHSGFHPQNPLTAISNVKQWIPARPAPTPNYIESWVQPGWDCFPYGSRDPSKPEARFTTELLQYICDSDLPIVSNLEKNPLSSLESLSRFAREAQEARKAGKPDWRKQKGSGNNPDEADLVMYPGSVVQITLTMSTEIKKKLPEEGVRWLYLQSHVKGIINGRMDLEVVVFDEGLDVVAISHQVAFVSPTSAKVERKEKL